MKYAFCTSFSPQGYELYGKRFLEGFLRYSNFPIYVYHENSEPDLKGPIYKNLFQQNELMEFLKDCPPDGMNYRFQANRFARKVFAVTNTKEADWWIWIDADVEVFGPINEAFLDKVCPDGYDGSYIGRRDWHHSECGFVGYRGEETLKRLRRVYTSGELFALDEWHDSFVFDCVRTGKWFDIAHNIGGMHPWPDTALGSVMTHFKGPRAKHALQTA